MYHYFKMEKLYALTLIQPGSFLASMDMLKMLNVTILTATEHKKCTYGFNGKTKAVYMFWVNKCSTYFHRIHMGHFILNFLLIGDTKEECLSNIDVMFQTMMVLFTVIYVIHGTTPNANVSDELYL